MILKPLNAIAAVLLIASASARATEAMVSYIDGEGIGYTVVGGWTFQPVTNISVTSLGCLDSLLPGQEPIQVGLWDSEGTLLASNAITCTSPLMNQSRYEPITPVTLRETRTYYVGAYSTNGAILLGAEDPNGFGGSATMSPGIVLGMAALSTNGYSSGLVFPSELVLDPGSAFLAPNFQYTGASVHGIQFTSLVSFGFTNGAYPNTSLTQGTDGNLYGTTFFGGPSDYGTAFRVSTNGLLSSVHSFVNSDDDANGAYPNGGLAPGNDGNLYGTTYATSRTGGTGTIFSMHTVLKTNESLSTLFRFEPEFFVGGQASYTNSTGGHPVCRLTLGNDGNFYGSTQVDGTNGSGTIFVTTPAGLLTSLASFDAASDDGTGTFTITNIFGRYPGDLTLGSDGNFYGAASSAGPGGVGTLFNVTTNGQLTAFFTFDRAVYDDTVGVYSNAFGAFPNSRLTLGNDGCFYGTTSDGGSNRVGTVFKVTTNGVFTPLFAFGGGDFDQSNTYTNANGAFPSCGLTLGPDGNLYGTTKSGGAVGDGTIFNITTNGVLTTLVTFYGTNGAAPLAPMTLATDGDLYGTTSSGGVFGNGTVFELAFGPPESIPLSISTDGNEVVLTWTNAVFGLQSAPDLYSTFTNVPGATSPFTNVISAPQQYFRLIAN